MQYSITHPMAPTPQPSPTTIPQATVTVPAAPPPATVTAPAPQAPQIQQWNPSSAGQAVKVQPMPSVEAAPGGGVSIAGIMSFVIGFLLLVFVVAGIVSMLMTVFGKERSDTKKAAKAFAVVAIAAAGISLLVGSALFTIMNGVVQSLVSGIGG